MARRSDYQPCMDTTTPPNSTWKLANGGIQTTTMNPDGSVSVAWVEIVRGACPMRVKS